MSVPFLHALPQDQQAALLDAMRDVQVDAQHSLFRQGERGDGFAILISGRVKVITRAETGRSVLVGMRGPGELVGELALLGATERTADVVTVDPVRARIGSASVFQRLVLDRPATLRVLCDSLAERLRESDAARIEVAALHGNARLAARLIHLAERYGRPGADGVRIDLPITQEELADWTATSRPVVTRALAEFRSAGFVATSRRSISVTDVSGLRAYVDRAGSADLGQRLT